MYLTRPQADELLAAVASLSLHPQSLVFGDIYSAYTQYVSFLCLFPLIIIAQT